jgi:hypothetical protein
VDTMLLRVFQGQVEIQCRHDLYAFGHIADAIQRKDPLLVRNIDVPSRGDSPTRRGMALRRAVWPQNGPPEGLLSWTSSGDGYCPLWDGRVGS